MKVLIVVDKIESALGRLSEPIRQFNPHIHIEILAVHPKRPSEEQLEQFEYWCKECDVIHFQYWKSAEMLMTRYPGLWKKPLILTHHNPYDIENVPLEHYDHHVVKNSYQLKKITELMKQRDLKIPVHVVPHTVDFSLFSYEHIRERTPHDQFTVGMVAARIESSKGIVPIAKACASLRFKFLLIGRISDREYFHTIQSVAGGWLEFRENIDDQSLAKAYKDMDLLVVNSKDDFESGPLPVLEAMASGTPVMSRKVGLVPDLMGNNRNIYIRMGDVYDLDDITLSLTHLFEKQSLRDELSENGWYSIKNRPHEIAARAYRQIYYDSMYRGRFATGEIQHGLPTVSVIIPTYNRADTLHSVITSVLVQEYPRLEIVVVDDSSTDFTEAVVKECQQFSRIPIVYLNTGHYDHAGNRIDHYGLAEARNLGAIESSGEILVFLDDRLKLSNAYSIAELIQPIRLTPKTVTWGVKDESPKEFVENFSAIDRRDFFRVGMFNERMKWYGGTSQEFRERLRSLGWSLFRADNAHATSFRKSSGYRRRREDIIKAKFMLSKMGKR